MIPFATDTVTITRLSGGDPNDEYELDSQTDLVYPTVSTVKVAEGLRMVISGGGGSRAFGSIGEQEHLVFKFKCDLIPDDSVRGDDIIIVADGTTYNVSWARTRSVLGMSFIYGECFQQTGQLT